MHRPPRARRRPRPRRPHRTAPVVFFLPQSYDPYDPYYGYDQDYESRHHRFTEQHYPDDDIDEDNGYEYDDVNYDGEQEFWYQRQPSGANPRDTEFHSHHDQRQPSGTDSRYTNYPHRERNPSESSNHQTSRQTSSRSNSCGTGMTM